MASPITYSVSIAWSSNLTGVFRVGYSTVDGTDPIGAGFGFNAFDDISAYTREISIRRGRTDDLGPMAQGTCSITLVDRGGRFNPENPSSDLYGLLVPLRPLQITANFLGKALPLFYGYIERIEHDPLHDLTRIDAVDFFEWIDRASDAFIAAATTVGSAIGEMLDLLQFTDPAYRSLDAGRTINQPGIAKPGSYLTQIGDLATYDGGLFFMTAGGVATYVSGSNYWSNFPFIGTIDGQYTSDMRVAVDKQRVVNRETVNKVGFATVEADDTVSQAAYGFRDGDPITSYYLAYDDVSHTTAAIEATALANWIVATRKDPGVPTRSLEIKGGSDAQLLEQITLDIGSRIIFSEPRGNTSSDGIIEGVQHKVKVGTIHTTKFLVSKRKRSAFTVGTSAVGGDDLLYW